MSTRASLRSTPPASTTRPPTSAASPSTPTDDAAAFSGNDQGAVTEDANVSAANTLDYSGKLNVADVDQGQSSFDTSRVDN
ncbi:hypothetical protein ABD440_22390, partial [Chromobacterium piscinae]|uniref:hypothetical protein n=1 Tax=Chromobacterium piscinae TaxID=686831 RepID=UPI0031FD34BE